MSPSRTIRIGVIGAGHNSRVRHIPGLLALENVEVVALSNRSRDSSERVAREFGIDGIYDNWESLVAAPDIDAVVIGTWPNMHHPVTLAALRAGKHVLCEARMAMNSDEAEEMAEEARRHPELTARLVPSPLSFRVDNTIRRIIDDGSLGTVFGVDIDFKDGSFTDPDAAMHWREDRALSGNNIMALGIWYETLMRWIGPAEWVFAAGQTSVAFRLGPDGPIDAEIPDYIDVIAGFALGMQAHFQLSTAAGLTATNRASIYGTDGTLRFEDGSLSMGRRGDHSLAPLEIPESEASEWKVEEDFVSAIRGIGEPGPTDFETGVRYMEFTDAVWSSMSERRLVDLPTGGNRGKEQGISTKERAS